MNMNNEVLQVRLEDIVPNRFQPREHFADDGIEELAQSIKEHGIIQPLVLRKLGDKYEIIAGERRYKAATLAGLSTVPAILSDIDDNKSAEIALVENIQRRNLTSIEEARSYKAILDKGYLTQDGLAQKMGVSQSQIANKLRLLNLCEEVQEALMTGKISERHARALLVISDFNEQKMWLDRILKERLTVRQLDVLLKNNGNDNEEGVENSIPKVSINPDLEDIKNRAQDIISEPQVKDLSSIFNLDPNLLNIDNTTKEEVVEQKVEENKEEPLNTNRFFNFLEDEGPNMNMEEPITNPFITQSNVVNEVVPTEEAPSAPVNNMDVTPSSPASFINPFMDEPANNGVPNVAPTENAVNPFMNPVPETNNVSNEPFSNNFINPFMEETNMASEVAPVTQAPSAPINNMEATPSAPASFINPFMNEPTESVEVNNLVETAPINPFTEVNPVNQNINPQPVEINNLPNVNNVINDLNYNINNNAIDPMARVEQLNPNYVPPVVQEEKFTLNDAIKDIRNIASELERKGFYVNVEEIALADGYKFTIDIKN